MPHPDQGTLKLMARKILSINHLSGADRSGPITLQQGGSGNIVMYAEHTDEFCCSHYRQSFESAPAHSPHGKAAGEMSVK